MRQSVKILNQVLANMPAGPINVTDPKNFPPPKTEVLTKMEQLIHHFIIHTEGIDAPPGRNLFRRGKPEGRARFLHQLQGGRHAAPAQDPRPFLLQPQHPARDPAGAHDERRRRHPGLARFRHGRVRPLMSHARLLHLSRAALVPAAWSLRACACCRAASGSCSDANLGCVKPDMNPKEVESVLGQPTSTSTAELPLQTAGQDPANAALFLPAGGQDGRRSTSWMANSCGQEGSFDK